MSKKPVGKPVARGEPRVRRAYFECRFGQLHVQNAIPPGGGFDEGTSLLCLHPTPLSGGVFAGLLRTMGHDRSVYAPDLPGYGESDAPPAAPTIADYAGALGDFLDAMRFRQIDVLGSHTGAAIAAELAVGRPQQVRRVVLAGVPLFTASERDAVARSTASLPHGDDDGRLLAEWHRSVEWGRPDMPFAVVVQQFAQKLLAGPRAGWGMAAALQYPLRERLSLVRQPLLVLRVRDASPDTSLRVREVLPAARFADPPEGQVRGLFDADPRAALRAVQEFLA